MPTAIHAFAEPTAPSFKSQKKELVDRFERQYLITLLTQHQMNLPAAARAARISVRLLRSLIRKHQILLQTARPAHLEHLFSSTRRHFAERVRAFYGEQLRADVDGIAFQLMKLELASRT